jgi:MFS family permease
MMVLPFIALYAVEELKVSVSEAGLVLACFGAGAFISAPFAGKLSDRFGSLQLMIVSLLASGIFLFIYSFISNFITFLILSFLWAIISEAFRPASMSFISQEITSNRRKTAFALNRLAINLGMSIGPVLGGILSTVNFSLLFYVDGITSIAAGLFLLFSKIKVQQPGLPGNNAQVASIGNDRKSVFNNKAFLYFLVALIPVEIVFFQHIGALPIFIVNDLGFIKSTFGLLMGVNTVLIILVEVPLNDAMRNWKHWQSLSLGAFLAAAGFGILVFADGLFLIIASVITWTFGEMILFPAAGDYVAEISPQGKSGEYMGYFQMTFSLAFILGPLLGTKLLEDFGSDFLWSLIFILGIASAALMIKLKNKKAPT